MNPNLQYRLYSSHLSSMIHILCSVPLTTLAYLWDVYFTEGWKFVFRVGIAILQALEPQLLELDLEHMSTFLKSVRGKAESYPILAPEALVKRSIAVKITTKKLVELQELFEAKSLRQKVSEHPRAMVFQGMMRNHELLVMEDAVFLRGKIEGCHVDITKAEEAFKIKSKMFEDATSLMHEILEGTLSTVMIGKFNLYFECILNCIPK